MEIDSEKFPAVNHGEFLRFVITGLIATAGNLSVVWMAGHVLNYQLALLPGLLTGSVISFLLSKTFAFRARGWGRARGEAARFVIVYGCGAAIYYGVSFLAGDFIFPLWLSRRSSELLGVVAGAGVMTFTSYFGHRFYTYNKVASSTQAPTNTAVS